MGFGEIPVGLGMALAMDSEAMTAFAALPEREKTKILERASGALSKEEMQALVRSITEK